MGLRGPWIWEFVKKIRVGHNIESYRVGVIARSCALVAFGTWTAAAEEKGGGKVREKVHEQVREKVGEKMREKSAGKKCGKKCRKKIGEAQEKVPEMVSEKVQEKSSEKINVGILRPKKKIPTFFPALFPAP